MKTLPDNPNLEHLRRQAKDLLSGLRDSRPAATLAEAQASLAEQYGFGKWVDLKAEVDRLRGQGDVAAPTLASQVADRFQLGAVNGEMRSVSRADELGRQWSLETDRGRWLVRTMDHWVPIVDAETDVALQQAAARVGVLVPAAVRSRSGALVESIGGHQWRVCEWRHSGPPLAAPVSAATTYRVGRILATIHQLALPVDRICPWHAKRLSGTSWPDLAERARTADADWADALAEAVWTLAALDAIGEGEPLDPPVLCHNTLGPAKVRRRANGELVVVDWEQAGGQPPSWELGEALLHWTRGPGGGINVAGARAMLEGYRSCAGALPPVGMAMFSGAASSFSNYVASEVSQALAAGDAERRRHADRSVRHVLSIVPDRALLEQLLEVARREADAAQPGRAASHRCQVWRRTGSQG